MDIVEVFCLNVFVLVELMWYFVCLVGLFYFFMVVNISFGVGCNLLFLWLSYCSLKVVFDMVFCVFYLEEQELGKQVKVYVVVLGIVDIVMQDQICCIVLENFFFLDCFVWYKVDGELVLFDEFGKKLDWLFVLGDMGGGLYLFWDF